MAQFYNLLFLIFAVALCVKAKPQANVFSLVSFKLVLKKIVLLF